MRPVFRWLIAIAVLGGGAGWALSAPEALPEDALDGLTGDPVAGERIFWAGGCASCHAAPESEGEDRLVLSGGQRFPTEFGTFIAPNISPDPEAGIGGWSDRDFVNALRNGVSPDGRHYYPAFPYSSYRLADTQDLVDLHAFMATLPPSDAESRPHAVAFPFSIRRGIGLWKRLFLRDGYTVAGDLTGDAAHGRYLAEALAHCGECHTARGALGELDRRVWLAGAPDPVGDGRIPNITPGGLDWSDQEVLDYLTDGFEPNFAGSAGGAMAEVVQNLAELPEEDRAAIVAYLRAVPAVTSEQTP
ncbi:diacylglycerol kinase [Rhodobacterales bacterium HKCCE3408]|nr:diacylglycerol kinase [Rhodobacterales bacterium HKCCE3408]